MQQARRHETKEAFRVFIFHNFEIHLRLEISLWRMKITHVLLVWILLFILSMLY